MPTHFNPSRSLAPAVAPSFAIASGIIALATAYLAEYAGGLYPCTLCYWQRIPYALIIAAGLVAFLIRHKYRPLSKLFTGACLLLLFVSVGLGIFHAGVEYGWWEGPATCSAEIDSTLSMEELRASILNRPAVSCKDAAMRIMGLSMAGWNAVYASFCAFILFLFIRRT